jgi:hypothetical protein
MRATIASNSAIAASKFSGGDCVNDSSDFFGDLAMTFFQKRESAILAQRRFFYPQISADSRRFLKPFYPLITLMTRIFADFFGCYTEAWTKFPSGGGVAREARRGGLLDKPRDNE